jgi:hypothetical protein
MSEETTQKELQIGFSFWLYCAIFLLTCAVITSRRPDSILHAQLWAEDGRVWIADAYNLGWWPALFRPWFGVFQTLPRLVASLALLAPLSTVPLLLSILAIAFYAIPVPVLISSRSSAWGSLRFRVLLAITYIVLPNCAELSLGITQSQWHLALSAFLLLVASAPSGGGGRLFDLSVFLLCGMTGPFCIFLFPIAIFLAWKSSDRWRWVSAGIFAVSCFVQAWGMLIVNPSGRSYSALGADPALFARILAGQVYVGTLLGGNGLAAIQGLRMTIFLILLAICGTLIVAICFVNSSIEMRLFLLFSSMLFAASLIAPTCFPPPGVSKWEVMAACGGIRYWFLPTIAFAWSILWCFHSRNVILKTVSAFLLCLMPFGIIRDWRHPVLPDLHFAEDVKRPQELMLPFLKIRKAGR